MKLLDHTGFVTSSARSIYTGVPWSCTSIVSYSTLPATQLRAPRQLQVYNPYAFFAVPPKIIARSSSPNVAIQHIFSTTSRHLGHASSPMPSSVHRGQSLPYMILSAPKVASTMPSQPSVDWKMCETGCSRRDAGRLEMQPESFIYVLLALLRVYMAVRQAWKEGSEVML